MGYGMTMNGTPAVFGAGMDSNNLLDVRDAAERNNQGTIRADRMFGNSGTLNVRFSSGNEQGFTPQTCRLRLHFDNASQNGAIIWTRISRQPSSTRLPWASPVSPCSTGRRTTS